MMKSISINEVDFLVTPHFNKDYVSLRTLLAVKASSVRLSNNCPHACLCVVVMLVYFRAHKGFSLSSSSQMLKENFSEPLQPEHVIIWNPRPSKVSYRVHENSKDVRIICLALPLTLISWYVYKHDIWVFPKYFSWIHRIRWQFLLQKKDYSSFQPKDTN